jgi:NADH-quinone oxidoreductase subunit M
LWAYQRVFYGKITHPENRELPDLNHREQWVMVTMCALILWLGIHATFFLRRYEVSCQAILQQASPNVGTGATGTKQSQALNQPYRR